MPEIAEVARIVHYIRKHLVGKTLTKVTAADDALVYGKVGTSGAEFEKAMAGKMVVDAGQQGKYFWMIMSSPPHAVMHFGMTGWLKIKSEETYYYKTTKKEAVEEWPPKFWKYHLETDGDPKVEAAFVDARRLGRVRLVHCKADDIRKVTPLVENGPDPVVDKDLVTEEWLVAKCRGKKVPIKAFLLDQANISGIGNWVGDEIMYHAKIHPEQYSNTLSDEQLGKLHKSIHYICSTSVNLLGDSDQLPDTWLFRHRWSKGKKESSNRLPNGEKIVFLTIGGRTSAVVPSVQKKTSSVAKGMAGAEDDATGGSLVEEVKGGKKRKSEGPPKLETLNKGRKITSIRESQASPPLKRGGRSKVKEKSNNEVDDSTVLTKVISETRGSVTKESTLLGPSRQSARSNMNVEEARPPMKRKKMNEVPDVNATSIRRRPIRNTKA